MRSCTPVSGLTCWTCSLPLCSPPLMLSLGNCFTSETKWSEKREAARWQHCKHSMAMYDYGKSRRSLFKIMVVFADHTEISSVPQRFQTSRSASWAKRDHQSLTKITGNTHAAPALNVTRTIASPTSPLLPFTLEHFANPSLQWWRQHGQDIDLDCGIGLSVGCHRDLMLRPGEVMFIYKHRRIQALPFCLRK